MKHQFRVPLQDDRVLLRSLTEPDYEALYNIARDPDIWSLHNAHDRWKPEVFELFFKEALENELGSYVIIDKTSGAVAGSTRYYRYQPETSLVFIGYTFIARSYWGTGLNGRIKKLMLDHAFKITSCVGFDIYEKNLRSQKAVVKLGAFLNKKEYQKQQWLLTRSHWIKQDSL